MPYQSWIGFLVALFRLLLDRHLVAEGSLCLLLGSTALGFGLELLLPLGRDLEGGALEGFDPLRVGPELPLRVTPEEAGDAVRLAGGELAHLGENARDASLLGLVGLPGGLLGLGLALGLRLGGIGRLGPLEVGLQALDGGGGLQPPGHLARRLRLDQKGPPLLRLGLEGLEELGRQAEALRLGLHGLEGEEIRLPADDLLGLGPGLGLRGLERVGLAGDLARQHVHQGTGRDGGGGDDGLGVGVLGHVDST